MREVTRNGISFLGSKERTWHLCSELIICHGFSSGHHRFHTHSKLNFKFWSRRILTDSNTKTYFSKGPESQIKGRNVCSPNVSCCWQVICSRFQCWKRPVVWQLEQQILAWGLAFKSICLWTVKTTLCNKNSIKT